MNEHPAPHVASATNEHSVRDALPDPYGSASDAAGLNPQMRQVIQELQEALNRTIVAECAKEMAKRGDSEANWYLSFAQALKASLPMHDDFVRKLVQTAADTADQDDSIDLDALDVACRESLETTTRLMELLRDQAAQCT